MTAAWLTWKEKEWNELSMQIHLIRQSNFFVQDKYLYKIQETHSPLNDQAH